MTTISVPITADLMSFIDSEIEQGNAENKASLVRRALKFYAEHQAVQTVLRASKEETLHGDLRVLANAL